ncbi:MAG: DUF2723 domain-containing protein [Dehalococcoidia bacterium]|jgi:hypothetical protein
MNVTALEAAAAEAGRRARARAVPVALAPAWALNIAFAGVVFTVNLLVYMATLAPGLTHITIGNLDGPELATVPAKLWLIHSPGYPLYTWLAKLFTYLPAGDVAHRMNLFSAVSGSLAAVVLYGIVVMLTRRRFAALVAAFLFAFSVDFWSQAVITEVYAPNTFMVALTLFLFLYWGERMRARAAQGLSDARVSLPFLAACFVFGLSLGTHLSDIAFIPAIIAYVLLVRQRSPLPRRVLLGGVGLFFLATCQFAWLALRASTLNDKLLLGHTPDSPWGIFDYMFNVYHSTSLGFPYFLPTDLAHKLATYGGLLLRNFGPWGIGLGLVGAWDLMRRRREAFWLLAIGYATVVLYFTTWNYDRYDLTIFVIPSHLIFAVCIGLGVCVLMERASRLPARIATWRRPLNAGLCVLLLIPVLHQVGAGWSANDESTDSAVDDFYRNVYQVLPANATVFGNPGILGYDLFHYPLVEGIRPDVTLPQVHDPYASPATDVDSSPVYSTVNASIDGDHGRIDLPDDAWFVPVLAAPSTSSSWLGDIPLDLYEMRTQPPPFLVQQATPQHVVGRDMDGVELVGFDLDRTQVKAGGTLHVTFYWRPTKPPALNYYRVSTTIGDERYREKHYLGFGLLRQYQKHLGLPAGSIIVEDYNLVVLSSVPEGQHPLRLATIDYGPFGSRSEQSLVIASIQVTH